MHQWGNPLSIPMRLLSREDIDFTPTDDSSFESDKHVIFLHGLCMHDSDWNDKEHHSFVNTLRQHGFEPYWLRYNSGRSISENGREFHELMTAFDRQLPDDHTVTLIGHSMGGLIVRSACYYAEQNKSNWLDRVTGTAYLGSPHFGAPLERIGYLANQLLGVLPFTKPFMRLGQLRGRGIRELRYGSVFPDDEDPKKNGPIRLTDSMRHLFIGTTINELGEKTPLGDGMVPLTSALGEEESTNRKVVAERLERIHLQNIGHVELVSAPEVYSTLEDWVLRDSTPSNEATKPMSEPSPETTTA